MKTLRMLLYIVALMAGNSYSQTPLTSEVVVSGLNRPVFLTYAPGDSTRMFVIEQNGHIRVIRNDTLLTTSFLDITSIVGGGSGEQGLLGLAFHPEYNQNGKFYVNYTDLSGDTQIDQFVVSANPDIASPSVQQSIMTVGQPFSNHNGGMVAFSPIDGYLYIGLGDGGSGGDPGNRSQNPLTMLGKLIRIDVNGATPYEIPPDNPYAGVVDTLDEIWAMGLRNPWRYSFDRSTGDLYIADVGQGELEEIDFQPAVSTGKENYGWRLKEGTACFEPSNNCDPGGLTDPIHEFSHGLPDFHCSITGGYVYRGCAIPNLNGSYFFADFCSGHVWSFQFDGSVLTNLNDRTVELGGGLGSISSFGEDYYGELYILNLNAGTVHKVIPDGVASECSACCHDRGNGDGIIGPAGPVDVNDLTYLVSYLFKGGLIPPCTEEGNVDAIFGPAGPIDVSDVTRLVSFLFKAGIPLTACIVVA